MGTERRVQKNIRVSRNVLLEADSTVLVHQKRSAINFHYWYSFACLGVLRSSQE
jgi:hypothetical protein